MILNTIKDIADALDKVFPVHLFSINEDGKIRWANKRLLELSQISNLKAIKGKHVSIFGEKEWLVSKRIIESKKSEVLYEKANNKDFITLKIPYIQGGFRGLAGLSIDITQLRQAELAKQEFLLSMGHDIRTPFSAIVGLLGLLYANEADPEKKVWVEGILHSCEWVLNFMNDIQEIAELGYLPLNYEMCDMQAIVADIVLFSKAATTLKQLTIETHCEVTSVCIDSFRIKQILLNLLDNAIKFTAQGSITITVHQKTSALIITILDTGIGIDEAYHEKIFEEYFQVIPCYKKQGYVGIGKGLYLVKQYVEALHGTIGLRSEAGKGSSFTVAIPLEKVSTQAEEVIH